MEHEPPKTGMSIEGLVRDYNLEPDEMTARITPAEDLFVLAHIGVPEVNIPDWSLEICGLVDKPTTLSFKDLLGLPKRTVETVHKCAGSPFDPTIPTRQVGNVRWTGVDLRDVMQEVGVHDDATYLWAYGPDHGEFADNDQNFYQKDVPISRLQEGDVLIAYDLNDDPLSPKHGYPARLIVPGYYATNSVKWLYRLQFADHRADGFFTTTLYNDPDYDADPSGKVTKPVWKIAPESVLVYPAADDKLQGGEIEIWGWAWSSCRVQAVEVSTDGGQSWGEATLEPPVERSWQRFSTVWTPPATGTFDIQCRATDIDGEIQPGDGARNAVHSIAVTVS